jgi:hypothetical protein
VSTGTVWYRAEKEVWHRGSGGGGGGNRRPPVVCVKGCLVMILKSEVENRSALSVTLGWRSVGVKASMRESGRVKPAISIGPSNHRKGAWFASICSGVSPTRAGV